MRQSFLLIICLFVQIAFTVQAQETGKINYTLHQSDSLGKKPNYLIIEPPSVKEDARSSEARVIVRFKGRPLANANKNERFASDIDKVHQQFLTDLQKLEQSPSMRTNASPSQILFEYREVFNGFALVTSTHIKEAIEKLPYVSHVTEDKKVQISSQPGIQAIQAPMVWSELNITGKGVTIGIIDTGIDYNHPDLGAVLGQALK